MPRTAILYIAERCNQKCVFCLEENGEWAEFIDPSTVEVFGVLDRLRGLGGEHITFMGGETFFRKDLDRIIAHAKEVGYTRVGVTTNGTVLSKPGFIQRTAHVLLPARPQSLQVFRRGRDHCRRVPPQACLQLARNEPCTRGSRPRSR